MGDKPIEVEYLSDQTINFAESLTQTVNYEDPNMNIQLPIYSIHGNHDDVSGFGRLSAMDILCSSGLLNYFGKWTDLTKIHISPIVLRKGKTRLAIYGLSHIHDSRLARLFLDAKVTFQKPAGDNEDWFNIMVLHQNRADRGLKNFLPEESLPKFLDLAIWGHEHDCRINPEQNAKNGVYITQPGSSVATSLSEGEAEPKHCGLLLISQKNFKMIPIKLETVRPFIFETIDLEDYQEELDDAEGDLHEKVYQFCVRKIQQMIEKSKEKLSGNPKQPTIPLIRLRVIYNDEEQLCNPIRLGQQFTKDIANSTDVVKFIKQVSKKSKGAQVRVDESVLKAAYQQAQQTRAEDVVNQYFADLQADDQKLELFHSKTLSEMCRRLVDNDDDDAADIILKHEMKLAINYLQEKNATDENIKDFITDFRDFKGDEVHNSILGMLDANPNKRTQVASSNNGGLGGSSSDDDVVLARPAGRGAVRGGRGASARGANTSTRGTRGRGRGAKAAAPPDPPSTGLNVKVNVRFPAIFFLIFNPTFLFNSTEKHQQSSC